MGIYQFIASIVDSIAWPATVLIALYFFKGHIFEILPFIRKIKIKDFELDLKEAKQSINKGLEPKELAATKEDDKFSQLYLLAELSPRSAILESWLLLESVATNLAVKETNKQPGSLLAVLPRCIGGYLARKGLISKKDLEFFDRLKELRNKAAHLSDMKISFQDASDYIDMARTLASKLEIINEP